MVPFHQNIVVATDFHQGILFMEILCIEDISCSYLPVAVIAENGVSEISVMRSEGLVNENILFV